MMNNNSGQKIIIAGDLLPSGNNLKFFEEGNVEAIFDEKITSLFRNSDYSIFNLEGPLTNSNMKMPKTGPVVKASKECIEGIRGLGVKAVALANNHTTDYQQEGYKETVSLLSDNGIDYLGAGENIGGIKKYISLSLGNRSVCIYNVSEKFYNIPSDLTLGANIYDEYVVCNDIKELKQSHDYLIVIYHGGTEEFPYPTPLLRQHFHRMADCGADFITAQHTHCIGCFEKYNGSYLLYGQGNFLFARMKKDIARHGLITELVFSVDDVAIKQHCVTTMLDDTLKYDEEQDLSAFYMRSDELDDEDSIRKKYYHFCYNASIIKDRFLNSFRGTSSIQRLLKKLPGHLYEKHFLEQYDKEQLMRMAKCMESERYAENMFACIQFMMSNKQKGQ